MCSKIQSSMTFDGSLETLIEEMEEFDLNGNCLFFQAVTDSNYPLIQLYLEQGGDIDLVNPFNLKTALFICVDNGNLEMIKFLTRNGANLKHTDAAGMSFDEYFQAFF